MCGTMVKKRRRLILVVGGLNEQALADCEYTELPTIQWKKCNDLPKAFYASQLIEDPETGDVLLLGGYDGTSVKDTIYKLSDISGEWILQDKTLQAARSEFSAMVVPPGIFSCEKTNKHDEL